MSGARYTEDLQSIKTRQFILQNPDGSFPPLGAVLAFTDSGGKIQPVADISVRSLTVDQINITGTINQNILSTPSIRTTDLSVDTLTASATVSAIDISATNLYARTVTTDSLNAATFYSPQVINLTDSANIKLTNLRVGNVANTGILEVGTITSPAMTTNMLAVTDLSANNVSSQIYTTRACNVYDLSAAYASVNNLVGNVGSVTGILSTSVAAGNLNSRDLTVRDMSAQYIDISGDITVTNSLFTKKTVATRIIVATNDISTGSFAAASGTFTNINATSFNVPERNQNGFISSLTQTTPLNVSTTYVGGMTTGTIDISGICTFNDLTLGSVTTSEFISPSITSTNTSTNSISGTTMNISGSVVSYNSAQGLTVKGVPASNIALLAPKLFHKLSESSNILNAVNTYNSFLQILSDTGFIILRQPVYDRTPSIVFNSPASMQFIISGRPTAPFTCVSGSSFTLQSLTRQLNAISAPNLSFQPVLQGTGWTVAINVGNGGGVFLEFLNETFQKVRIFWYWVLYVVN